MDNPVKTLIARHQNVTQHVSSKKPLSTTTAGRHAHAISCHHARKVKPTFKVYLTVAPDGVLTYGKSKFALKYSNGKGMPSGFSHFNCHRVVLSTQKIFKGLFNIGGWLVAAWSSPNAKNIVSGPLVQTQRPAQNPEH